MLLSPHAFRCLIVPCSSESTRTWMCWLTYLELSLLKQQIDKAFLIKVVVELDVFHWSDNKLRNNLQTD